MIRQAISCDICGAEKRQTNHWFVAWERADELRVSGWSSRNRMRAGDKHLCGQACLHKLVDDFMVRVIAQNSGSKAAEEPEPSAMPDASAMPVAGASASRRGAAARSTPAALSPGIDTSLTTAPSNADLDSSARLLPPAAEATTRPHTEAPSAPVDEPPRFASRNWRVEAWQREREREQRPSEHRPEIVARRMGGGD